MDLLREFRNKYRLSQGNASKLFGVSSGAWSFWEAGNKCYIVYVTENVRLLVEANIDDVIADQIPAKLYSLGGAGCLWWIIRSIDKKKRSKKATSDEKIPGSVPVVLVDPDVPGSGPPVQ